MTIDTTDQQAVTVAQEAMYLIRKGGYFYRPNAQGYTTSKADAGRYTLADAIAHSHPNGPNGPRDGMDYMLADEPAASSLASVSSASADDTDRANGVGQDELVAGIKRALQHPAGGHDGWTDAGMEDTFFRWPVIVNALNEALSSRSTALDEACNEDGSTDLHRGTPEPVPATNQAGEVERPVAYGSGLMGDHFKARGSGNAIELSCYGSLATQPATSQSKGTFACPICGKDTPHYHAPKESVEPIQCPECGVGRPGHESGCSRATVLTLGVREPFVSTQPATSQEGEGVSVAEYNEAHDKIEEVVGGAFRDGFEEGWIYAQTPDGSEYDERKQEFGRAVDIEPSEAWDGYRDKYVAMLPVPVLPTLKSEEAAR